jgi:alanyl-tRNA synthetase
VEALVSADAFAGLAKERALVANVAELLHAQPDQIEDRIAKLLAELKSAERQLAALRAERLAAQVPQLIADADQPGVYRYVGKALDVAGDDLRQLAIQVRDSFGVQPGVVALVGTAGGKAQLVVATTAAARDLGAKAGALVAVGAAKLGGKGGGRDDLAQGGGPDVSGVAAALEAIGTQLRK